MSINKNVAVFVGLALAVAVAGVAVPVSAAALTQAQIDAIIGLLQSFGADQSTISNVQASLTGGAPTGGTGGTTGGYVFNANLTMGSTGADVMNLQKVLNSDADTQVAASGVGSAGNESSYFGALTKAAVIKFQKKYGITPAVGYVGPITRAKLNSMGGVVVVVPPVTPPPAPAGTGLTVSAAQQPAAMLFPVNAARVPFTKVNFTAGSDGDVKVNSLVVERGGPSIDADVASIVLLDESGTQIGLSKTLNSAHQVTLSEPFTVKAGQTRTMTLAANRGADGDSSGAGAVFVLSLVAVNTSATVSGSLPIIGTAQTGNSGLTIGSVTNQRGALDPNGAVSKNVGTTGYIFSSVKVTAGSTEDVLIKSIRWNQASSAASSDLANLVTVIDGVSYPAVVDSTGKYYTSNFGTGIKIEKGYFKEISVKGDIVGGSARTVAFNIEKTTDLHIVGLLYNYGITPPTSGTGFTSGTIWYAASTITINSGSLTVTSDPSVPAQNIALNLANQPLGGFSVEVRGESISVARIAFDLSTTSTAAGRITNISLVDGNGAILAGPVDNVGTDGVEGVLFTDTVTFPIGVTKLRLQGKIGTVFANNSTLALNTAPGSNWTSATGQVTGQTITPSPSSDVTASTMTIKTAALTVSVSPNPSAQTVVAGGQGFTFTNYQLDAGASGEDLRISQLLLDYSNSGTATNLTNCQLWDGATALNTGSNAVNPSAAASSTSFILDSALNIPKGTSKALALKCNIASAATGSIYWGISATQTVTGITSGQSATVTQNSAAGQRMTLATGGSLSVTDASSPSYRVVAAGTTGNTVASLNFHASNEALTLQTVPLVMKPATSTNADVTLVTLWDGTTQVGSAYFDGTRDASNNFIATSTLSTAVTIPKDGDKILTVKIDSPNQGVNEPGNAGAFIAINWDGGVTTNATSGTKAVGQSSGSAIYASGSDTTVAGIRVFKSFPVITYSTTGATASAGVNDLLSVVITADAKGSVKLHRLSFVIGTTTATVDTLTFSGPNGNVASSTGLVSLTAGATTTAIYFDSTSNTNDAIVAAGNSKTYTLRGNVALLGNSNSTGSVSAALMADTAYPKLPTIGTATTTFNMAMSSTTGAIIGITNGNGVGGALNNSAIIWSPVSTTTTSSLTTGYDDWTNGYGLGGCFATSGLGQNCTARVISK